MFLVGVRGVDEDDVTEVEGRQLGGIDVSGGGRRERREQAGRVGPRRRE